MRSSSDIRPSWFASKVRNVSSWVNLSEEFRNNDRILIIPSKSSIICISKNELITSIPYLPATKSCNFCFDILKFALLCSVPKSLFKFFSASASSIFFSVWLLARFHCLLGFLLTFLGDLVGELGKIVLVCDLIYFEFNLELKLTLVVKSDFSWDGIYLYFL